MKHHIRHGAVALLMATTALAGCTMEKQEAPDLAGPSEFATSVTVSISPDVLTQDGASQGVVTITVRDANGQPLRNVTLRAEIVANGTLEDFGSLSARTVVTGADGRATLVYTAPMAPNVAVDQFTVIEIAVTPIGSNFQNSVMRFASVRLVPPGVIIPPDGLQPRFTFTPNAPQDHQRVLFDARPARRRGTTRSCPTPGTSATAERPLDGR